MIWAILAILGIPLWVIIGVLGGAFASRRHFQRSPGVFPLRMREATQEEQKWGGKAHARWVHDVLLVNKGVAEVRTIPFAVERIMDGPEPVGTPGVKGLGDRPVSFVVALDDGPDLQIVTSAELRAVALRPFDADAAPNEAH